MKETKISFHHTAHQYSPLKMLYKAVLGATNIFAPLFILKIGNAEITQHRIIVYHGICDIKRYEFVGTSKLNNKETC